MNDLKSQTSQIWFKNLEGFEQLTWLVGSIVEANEDITLKVDNFNGNIIFSDQDGGSIHLPLDVLAKENHAPDIAYTYLIIPAADLAAELERLRGLVTSFPERWTDHALPENITDVTRLEGEDADFAGLADQMIHYISVKANTPGIYENEELQRKYAAAMAVVIAVMHEINGRRGLLDSTAAAKLNVMRAGGAIEIITRAVATDEVPAEYPGAKRIVANPQGLEGDIDDNQMLMGLIDQDQTLQNIEPDSVIRFQEVVVASNATLMGFVTILDYLGRLPSAVEIVAPFVTQPGIRDFLKFCATRQIEVRVITASIDPALNNNWYVVVPPDNDADGKPTNPEYNRILEDLHGLVPEELYYMGDGGDLLNFLLKFIYSSPEEIRDCLYPLIANLANEIGGKDRQLILKLLPRISIYMEQ